MSKKPNALIAITKLNAVDNIDKAAISSIILS